jgi:hypothetical protein
MEGTINLHLHQRNVTNYYIDKAHAHQANGRPKGQLPHRAGKMRASMHK